MNKDALLAQRARFTTYTVLYKHKRMLASVQFLWIQLFDCTRNKMSLQDRYCRAETATLRLSPTACEKPIPVALEGKCQLLDVRPSD